MYSNKNENLLLLISSFVWTFFFAFFFIVFLKRVWLFFCQKKKPDEKSSFWIWCYSYWMFRHKPCSKAFKLGFMIFWVSCNAVATGDSLWKIFVFSSSSTSSLKRHRIKKRRRKERKTKYNRDVESKLK